MSRVTAFALCIVGLSACGGSSSAKPTRGAHAATSSGDASDPAPVESAASTPELFPAADLNRIGDALSHGTATARTIAAHAEYHYVEARRVRDGAPEVHDDWADLTFVPIGRARLLAGGHVAGARLASPGEHRGGTIVDGVSHVIASGDFFVIPPGVPHQYLIAPGDSIRYLTIKVARARRAAASR